MKLFDRLVLLSVVITFPFIALIIFRLLFHWKERGKHNARDDTDHQRHASFSHPFGEILHILPSEPSLDYVSERYAAGFHRFEVYDFQVGSELLLQTLDQNLMAFF